MTTQEQKLTEDAGPLCIDCKRNPQPARRDGKPGTHHRCDPCHQAHERREGLRTRLSDGQWFYLTLPQTKRCAYCAADVQPGTLLFLFDSVTCCHGCAADSGWKAAAVDATSTSQLLSADLRLYGDPGAVFISVHVPLAHPVIAATAIDLVRELPDKGVKCAVIAAPAAEVELFVDVCGGVEELDTVVPYAIACGSWLTQYALCVTVPSVLFEPIRQAVDKLWGSARASRLRRDGAAPDTPAPVGDP